MASIKNRGAKYSVLYNTQGPTNSTKQIWESGYYNYEDARNRQQEVEALLLAGIQPQSTRITVSEFCELWLPIHAKSNWQFNTYSSSVCCLKNHVLPYIGDIKLRDVSPLDIDKLISRLYTTRKKIYSGKKTKETRYGNYLSSTTIRLIYLLLHEMFEAAVNWRYLHSSPVLCKAPPRDTVEREIWTPDMFDYALNHMEQPILHLLIHMLFTCTLRIGELLALTIDDINLKDNSIHINKTLQRVTLPALEAIPHQHLLKCFPPKIGGNSRIILKKPKTKASYRTVYLTRPLADEIYSRIERIDAEQNFYQWKRNDRMLFCLPEDGSPIEPKLCAKWFSLWQREHSDQGFPFITFHNIRHSSATYKLLISNGDIKSVQGDTGHSTSTMLLNLYAHIQDSQRIKLTNSFEETFYKR